MSRASPSAIASPVPGRPLLRSLLRRSLVLLGALLAAVAAGAQSPDGFGPPAIPAGPQPQIEVPTPEHAFGRVHQGTVVTHSFPVRNRGTAPLRISRVQSNCGCTSTFFTEEIAAGGEGRVELRIDTAELAGGPQRKNATISSDDPAAPQVTLWLSGEVVPLLVPAVTPLRLAGICEEPKEETFRFGPGTGLATTVLSARTRDGVVEVVSSAPVEGGGTEVRLRAPPGAEPGVARDHLLLEVRLGDAAPVVAPFPVFVEHLDRLRITPNGNVVFFRRQTAHLETDPARDVSKELHVRPERPDLTCRVTAVRLEGIPEGLLRAEVREETPGQHYVVTVRVLRTSAESQVAGRLVIETDDPLRPTREREVLVQFRLKPPAG